MRERLNNGDEGERTLGPLVATRSHQHTPHTHIAPSRQETQSRTTHCSWVQPTTNLTTTCARLWGLFKLTTTPNRLLEIYYITTTYLTSGGNGAEAPPATAAQMLDKLRTAF